MRGIKNRQVAEMKNRDVLTGAYESKSVCRRTCTASCLDSAEQVKVKVKISLLQAVETHRVARG
jgi:hypothetical protein